MSNENSDAQNKEECGYSFKKHRQNPAQFLYKNGELCSVKEIQLSELNFPPRDDFEQRCARCLERSPRFIDLCEVHPGRRGY
jgi:hypothetical protein